METRPFDLPTSPRPLPWYKREGGEARLKEELRRLETQARPGGIKINEMLDTGDVMFTVVTPDPPGYTLYLQTDSDYPKSAPRVVAELHDVQKDANSRTITSWQSRNYLSQVVEDVANGATQRWRLLLLGIGGVVLLLAGIVGFIVFNAAQGRVEGDVIALHTLQTAQANATSTALVLDTQVALQQSQLAQNPNDPGAIATATALADQKAVAAAALNNQVASVTAQAVAIIATQTYVAGLQGATKSAAETVVAQTQVAEVATATMAADQTAHAPTATAVPTPTIPVVVIPTETPRPIVYPTPTVRVVPTVTAVPTAAPIPPTPIPPTATALPTSTDVPATTAIPDTATVPVVPVTDTPIVVNTDTPVPPTAPPPTATPVPTAVPPTDTPVPTSPPSSQVTVPSVSGMQLNSAQHLLSSDPYDFRVSTGIDFTCRKPSSKACGTNPGAGSTLNRGDFILLLKGTGRSSSIDAGWFSQLFWAIDK